MNQEEKLKSAVRKTIVVIIMTALIIFNISQIVKKLRDISEKRLREKEFLQSVKEADSLEAVTGTRIYKATQVFVPDDESFYLPIMIELTAFKSLLNDELLFVGVPNKVSEDKAELTVTKVPFDSTLTLKENWHRFEKRMLKNNPSANAFRPVDESEFHKDVIIFDVISKNGGLTGIVRLERRQSFLYIIKAQSVDKAWSKYRGAFSFSLNMFMFKK